MHGARLLFLITGATRPLMVNFLFQYVLLSSLEPKKKPSRFFVEQWKSACGPTEGPGSKPSSCDFPKKVWELRTDPPPC